MESKLSENAVQRQQSTEYCWAALWGQHSDLPSATKEAEVQAGEEWAVIGPYTSQ